MKSRLIATIATIACSAAWAHAALSAPVTYQLNKDHTDVTFTIGHAGLSLKHGSFAEVSGSLLLDTDHLSASSVDVTVAMKSIYTNHAKRDEELAGPQFFDSAQYPTMHFVSSKVSVVNATNLDIAGSLTLHGVTKPLVLHAKINKIGKSPFGGVQTAGFTAIGTLNRSDFGVNRMVPLLSDAVSIAIDAEFAIPQPEPVNPLNLPAASTVTLVVADLDKEIAWWQTVLGFHETTRTGGPRPAVRTDEMRRVELGGYRVDLVYHPGSTRPLPAARFQEGYSHISFTVEPSAIDADYQWLTAHGVEIDAVRNRATNALQIMRFKDPEGNEIHIEIPN